MFQRVQTESRFSSKNLTLGEVNAIVKKLGGEQGARRFLRDELKLADAKATELPAKRKSL